MRPRIDVAMKKTLFLLSLLMFTPAALADVPYGYTEVTITEGGQLSAYTEADYTAFIIAADVTDSTYRMTGAHQYWTDETLQTNNLTFTGLQDGALRVGGEVTMEKLNKLDFTSNGGENKSSSAITVANGVLTITGNKSVSLLYNFNNTPDCCGGAVSVFLQGVMTFSHNDAVLFEGNHSTVLMETDDVGTQGGAIYGKGELNVTDNGSVTFSKSEAFRGGAISTEGTMLMTGNRSLTFSGNKTPYEYRKNTQGGAMYVTGTSRHEITGNKRVEFSGNSAGDFGGAIFIETGSNFTLSNNESIEFNGNSISNPASRGCGGAIYSTGTLNITGNGSVVFRENVAEKGGAIYMEAGTLNLAAGEGQHISFYDTLYVFSSDTTVSFNARYTDAADETKDATGDIVFTGADGEAPTSVVSTVTNLYGGRLRVEDGAVYQGNGIAVAEGSNATVRLAGGSLQHSGYNITLAAGTTLEMQGVNNSISANTLDMQAGSTLSFVLECGNLNQAALNLNGAFNQGGTLNIVLQAGETYQAGDKLILMSLSSGEAPATWDASKITLSGLSTDMESLSWENGVLYYEFLPAPACWTGGESRVWNNRDMNWAQGETTCGNTDGLRVEFRDSGCGNVTLEGDLAPQKVLVDNSTGHDYTFAGDGRLTGTMLLTKDGGGTLAINTTNTYTGGTLLKGGTLVMGSENALGSGDVTLEGGTLNLGSRTLSNNVTVSGTNASIGNGIINGNLTVAENMSLALLANTSVTGAISLGQNSTLNLGGNTITQDVGVSGSATIGNGTINGNLTVAENKSLALLANTTVTGAISLGQNSTLNLGGNTITQDVGVSGSATIGNGSVNGNITFAVGNQQVSLCGNLGGTGDISIGVVNSGSPDLHPVYTSTLNLGGHTLSKGLKLVGDTTVSNGRLVLAHDMTWSLFDIQARTVTIGADTTVDLNEHTFSHNLAVKVDTAIGNGTIGGNVAVDVGKSVRFFGETKIDSNNEVGDDFVAYNGLVEAGKTKIQALHRPLESQIGAPVYPGLLKELTVSEKEIVGTGRATSLADGLEIQSQADLMIKGITITADNKISVGQNTITLNDVTIKLSQASYELVSGVYYFNLSDLFHCSVDMTDVTFDASDLTLPEGFNPETNAISFNLGDAKLTAETAERDIYLLMGGYGSRTMSIDNQGRPVFTALVPIPEPTTGTLSLLALAALAARRRK